ncbi:transmembrane protein, putative [Bodo saltans]|uniref:Transmembrane protein, putative n=1 Tax=Bodo saltans TaxID=75058 RepID=A0A0S4J2V1_BODSA|nr:transmembrane protein, putative [Bodo saltans]|eukprot:CUG70831.1 transmembrane protein, putative [Bodo saltans]
MAQPTYDFFYCCEAIQTSHQQHEQPSWRRNHTSRGAIAASLLLFFAIHESLVTPVAAQCYTSLSASACGASSCIWCTTTGTCLSSCLPSCGSISNSDVCSASSQCSWCSALDLCLPKTGSGSTCYASCNLASVDGSDFCAAAPLCYWCNALGICNSLSQTCYTSCPAASVQGSRYCGYSQVQCQWCSGVGICQAKSLTCYTSCAAVTVQGSTYCGYSQAQAQIQCQWCSVIGFCQSKSVTCATSCKTPGSDVCNLATNCHWCPQHGRGRCKPIKGRSLGYINWRGEVECETNTSSFSSSDVMSTTVTASHDGSQSLSQSNVMSRSGSVSVEFSNSRSIVFTQSRETPSISMEDSSTDSSSCSKSQSGMSPSRETTMSSSSSRTNNVSLSSVRSPTATNPISTTESFSSSVTHSRSESRSDSPTESSSPSSSHTDSPTISIDPCNTTFRDNPTSFVRHIALLNTEQYGTVNSTDSTFLVLNRVELATLRTLRILIGFNTYLRNFYYNTSMSWFPLPQVSNCISSGFELLNATDFIVRIDYNPDVSFSVGLDDDYFCNMTFSTDIFQCQLMTNFTFNFSAAILVTGTPRVVSASAAQAIGIASSILAIISSGVALLQQARAQNLASLAMCQFSLVDSLGIDQSPLQFGFGSAMQYYNRGCVVGNIALVAAIAALMFLVIMFVSCFVRGNVAVYERDQKQSPLEMILANEMNYQEAAEPLSIELSRIPQLEENHVHELQRTPLPGESNISLAEELFGLIDTQQPLPPWVFGPSALGDHHANTLHGRVSHSDGGEPPQTNPMSFLDAYSFEDFLDAQTSMLAADDELLVKATENIDTVSDSGGKKLLLSRQETLLEAFSRHAAAVSFPSILTVPACLLFDGTVSVSVGLLVHPVDPNDTLLGAVGVIACGGLIATCLVYTLRVMRKAAPVMVSISHPLVGSSLSQWLRVLRYLFLPYINFEATRRRYRHAQEMMACLLEDFRIPQFFCCDLALSALIASLAGVGISKRDLCTNLAAVALVGHILFVTAIIWLRPFTVRFAFGLGVVAAVLGCLSALFTFLSMYTGILIFGTINQYAEIGMVWVSTLGTVVVVISVVAYIRRRRQETAEAPRQHSRRAHRWARRMIRDAATGDEVDTGSSTEESDSDGNANTIIDGDGRTTQERAMIQQKLELEIAEQRRRDAELETVAQRILKETVDMEESVARMKLEKLEEDEFLDISVVSTSDKLTAEAYALNNTTWAHMLAKQQHADAEGYGESSDSDIADLRGRPRFRSLLLMSHDKDDAHQSFITPLMFSSAGESS